MNPFSFTEQEVPGLHVESFCGVTDDEVALALLPKYKSNKREQEAYFQKVLYIVDNLLRDTSWKPFIVSRSFLS